MSKLKELINQNQNIWSRQAVPEDQKQQDPINPSYYKLGLPCESLDYQLAVCNRVPGNEGALVFNVLKYTTRYSLKNGLEDLKKAQFYLEKLIDIVGKK